MIKIGQFVIVIIIILMIQTDGAQTVLTKEQSILTIDILENGNALWSEEIKYPLTSQSAISEWKLRLKGMGSISNVSDASNASNISGASNASNISGASNASNISSASNASNVSDAINIGTKKSTEINERINRSLLSAMNYSNRPMSIQNFNISYDLVDEESNAYGVIRWNLEWVNFSQIEGSNITIGNAFSDRVAPSLDNVLMINIPEGYEVVNASPGFDKHDGNRLIWDGTMYRSFGKGEPSLVISRKLISKDSQDSQDSFPTAIAIIIFLLGGSILFILIRWYFLKKKNGLKKDVISEQSISEAASKPGDLDAKDEEEIEPDENEAILSGINTDLPPITEDIPGYEEMIERYLIKCGGQAYQSDIVNESGLSKSTISIVLSRMKDEGRILKIRKGKENVIRQAKKD